MPEFGVSSHIPAKPEDVFAWHARPGAFERLAPPGSRFRVIEQRGTIEDGARNTFDVRVGPIWRRWVAAHDGYIENRRFRDTQLEGPLPRWIHTHEFEPEGDGTRLTDRVDFDMPLGAVGDTFSGLARRRLLEPMFAFRHARTRNDLIRHQRFASEPLHIAITGTRGFIGSALVPYLTTAGHRVSALTRSEAMNGFVPDDCDALIHLSGEPIAGRWTQAKRSAIHDSRVLSTRALAERMATMRRPPRVFVCASAIGIYGDSGEDVVDEDHRRGDGFLGDVVYDWEGATEPAKDAGIRVVNMRTGVVVGSGGGLIGQLHPAFKAGVGAIVGSGSQWISWIGLDDLIGAFEFALHSETVNGPVNVVAPEQMRHAEFMRALGGALHRPVLVRVPERLIRAALGEAASLVLDSQRVTSSRLESSGFEFLEPTLSDAFEWELAGIDPAYS